jgi:hypothetical protein
MLVWPVSGQSDTTGLHKTVLAGGSGNYRRESEHDRQPATLNDNLSIFSNNFLIL